MLDQMTGELGGIDIAVCNAGIVSVQAMLDMPLEEFQRIQDTNVTGVFLTAQAAAGRWSIRALAERSSRPRRCPDTSSTFLSRSATTARPRRRLFI
ncbi:short-chain type dehydrogenase/reductase [Mycobacterium ulcerans str. Harvey]|uniref:Short-chain type dehydrogenase/reductase n=1 Tax=Mycobacterium ulcerans str. Harvey TaxID=1299332 RepID=A0ABP3AH34_MYCUL|nr:short-chain type dehydrogenase/reductase [Mycobacterium ulcerans str. Harvey]